MIRRNQGYDEESKCKLHNDSGSQRMIRRNQGYDRNATSTSPTPDAATATEYSGDRSTQRSGQLPDWLRLWTRLQTASDDPGSRGPGAGGVEHTNAGRGD
jgi:hypothetical protein